MLLEQPELVSTAITDAVMSAYLLIIIMFKPPQTLLFLS